MFSSRFQAGYIEVLSDFYRKSYSLQVCLTFPLFSDLDLCPVYRVFLDWVEFSYLEATARIALAYIPFAEECLTTWLRGHMTRLFSKLLQLLYLLVWVGEKNTV